MRAEKEGGKKRAVGCRAGKRDCPPASELERKGYFSLDPRNPEADPPLFLSANLINFSSFLLLWSHVLRENFGQDTDVEWPSSSSTSHVRVANFFFFLLLIWECVDPMMVEEARPRAKRATDHRHNRHNKEV